MNPMKLIKNKCILFVYDISQRWTCYLNPQPLPKACFEIRAYPPSNTVMVARNRYTPAKATMLANVVNEGSLHLNAHTADILRLFVGRCCPTVSEGLPGKRHEPSGSIGNKISGADPACC